jgi:hypothetical protein
MVIVGLFLLYTGVQEVQVGWDSATEPVAVSLANLEKGVPPPNNHVSLDRHLRLYNTCVYQYTKPKNETRGPGPSTALNHTYYPVISEAHPFMARLAELEKRYGSLDSIPDQDWPKVDQFAVLIKTTTFHTLGAIPKEATICNSMAGMFINRIEQLTGEERRLLAGAYPGLDLSRVLILEENRRPGTRLKYLGFLGGGAGLVLVGAYLFFAPRLRKQETPPQMLS